MRTGPTGWFFRGFFHFDSKRCKEVCRVDLGESFHMSIYYLVLLCTIHYLLAKLGFDTAENEPCKFCPLSVYRSPRFPLRMSEEDLATRASHGIEMCYGASTPHLSFYEEADTEDVNAENVTFTSVRRKRRKDSSKLLRFHTESLDLSGMKCFLFRGGLVSQIPVSQYLSAGRQGKLSRARSRLYRSRFLQINS